MTNARISDCVVGWPHFDMVQPARYMFKNSNVLYMNLRDVFQSIGTAAGLDFASPLHLLKAFSALARGSWFDKGIWVWWSCLMKMRPEGGTEQVFLSQLTSLGYGELVPYFIDEVWGQRILDTVANGGVRAESVFIPSAFLHIHKQSRRIHITRKDGSTYSIKSVTC